METRGLPFQHLRCVVVVRVYCVLLGTLQARFFYLVDRFQNNIAMKRIVV